MQEFKFISELLSPLSSNNYLKNSSKIPQNIINKNPSQNLIDDVAIIEIPKHKLIISQDMMIENIHFLKSDGAYNIASKLLLSNLSDIASSGATPLYYTLGFTKNAQLNNQFYKDFVKALHDIQSKFKLILIGGDTSNSEILAYSITIFGICNKSKILSRNQAKIGDDIFVSNHIGDAFLGLNIKNIKNKSFNKNEKFLLNKHLIPQPRIDLGFELLNKKLSQCATDISDGLIADLTNICKSSKLNAEIYLDDIPLSNEAKNYIKTHDKYSINDLITGGEDYELIFTTSPNNSKKIQFLAKKLEIKITNIGKITPKKNNQNNKFKVVLYKNRYNVNKKFNQIFIEKTGYEHF
jgi:thiamine-monophosphate kinase